MAELLERWVRMREWFEEVQLNWIGTRKGKDGGGVWVRSYRVDRKAWKSERIVQALPPD